ncbi:MAG: CoA transferase [Deltaproteobacteria bacterium]|nr:CoA transferase [Deltaproteobacteria bacterium]
MTLSTMTETILGGKRVLDITDEKGLICGKQLGDMGADVIKIERPGGDPARNIGPFYNDEIHPEKSLHWFAFNLNKRGVTLDIENEQGKEIFREMVQDADFVIESFRPGYMEQQGLGYPDLEKINPRIVLVSISPFGQTGPHAQHKASDLTLMSMAGMVNLCGDPERPPLRMSVSQSYLFGGALCGAMAAHYFREITGQGQWVDVSIQQGLIYLTLQAPLMWDLNRINMTRSGSLARFVRREPDGTVKVVTGHTKFPTKDGYVEISLAGGPVYGSSTRSLFELMAETEEIPEELKDKEWEAMSMATVTQEELDSLADFTSKYCAKQNTMELYEETVKRRIMLAPQSTTEQLLLNPQLNARKFWVEVEHPELGTTITYPGPWTRFSETPLVFNRRAPLIGEHNAEIYGSEMGMSEEQLMTLKSNGVI